MEPCRLHELVGYEEIKKFLEEHKGFDSVAFDLETSGFDFINDKIRCIQLAFDEIDGYYIEWKEFEDHPDLIQILSDMLLSIPNRITQNGKFDIKFLWQNGVSREVTVTEDAMEMAHVLCSQRKKGLKTQSYYYTPYGGYDHQLDEYVKKQKKIRKVSDIPYSTIPKKILFPYSTMDPIMTFRTYVDTKIALEQFAIRFPTEKPIEHTGGHASTPYEWYKLYVMGLYPIICDTEFEGMCVDTEVMDKHRAILQEWEAEDRRKLVEIWKDMFGEDNYFLELQNHNIKEEILVADKIKQISSELNIPMVVTNDCHYIEKSESKMHEVLLCIQTNHTIYDEDKMEFQTEKFYLKTEEEIKR